MLYLRNQPPNLARYLPQFLQEDEHFKATLAACSTEHEKYRLLLDEITNQFYIETATWGLTDWERILDLKPDAGDNYEQRRNRILLKLQGRQVSTLDFMAAVASRYIDNKRAKIEEHNNLYYFDVSTDGTITDEKGFIDAINLYKPAHLSFGLHFQRSETGILHIGAAADNSTRYNMFPAVAKDSNIKTSLCIVSSHGSYIVNSISPVAGSGSINKTCNIYGVAPYILQSYEIKQEVK